MLCSISATSHSSIRQSSTILIISIRSENWVNLTKLCFQSKNRKRFKKRRNFLIFIPLYRRKKLEILRQITVNDDACTLCCENMANVVLMPCKHSDFCDSCIQRLNLCPICRTEISSYKLKENANIVAEEIILFD